MKKILFTFIVFFYCYFAIFSPNVLADDIDTEDYSFSNNSLETSSSDVFPNINSRAYIVYDRNTHSVLVGKNENMKRKMASTTNVMTS